MMDIRVKPMSILAILLVVATLALGACTSQPPVDNPEPPQATFDIPSGIYLGTARAFGGEMVVEVGVINGRLHTVRIMSHMDNSDYANQAIETVVGRMLGQQKIEVDVLSGATKTSIGIIAGVKNALAEYLEPQEPLDLAKLPNGKYRGEAFTRGGRVLVEVAIIAGSISEVVVLEHNDSPSYAEPAHAILVERLIQSQALDVEVVSGATGSSHGMLDAVEAALRSRRLILISEVPDGVYTGEAEGFIATIRVEVTVSQGSISDIRATRHRETPDYANLAFEGMRSRIMEGQSLVDIDVITGATDSASGFLEAVRNALDN